MNVNGELTVDGDVTLSSEKLVWYPPGGCSICTKQSNHAHTIPEVFPDSPFLEAYQRSRIGNSAASAFGGMIESQLKHVSYSSSGCSNIAPLPITAWHDEPARQYAQGMARGCWCGKAAGKHPGYRVTAR